MGTGSENPGEPCPLLDGAAAAEKAADGFGYSPAWYEAADPEGSHLTDPLPLDCEFTASVGDLCGATLDCEEHEYYAAFDADGALRCARDGEEYPPVRSDEEFQWDVCYAASVPAEACFGPGWSRYFQAAAEAQ